MDLFKIVLFLRLLSYIFLFCYFSEKICWIFTVLARNITLRCFRDLWLFCSEAKIYRKIPKTICNKKNPQVSFVANIFKKFDTKVDTSKRSPSFTMDTSTLLHHFAIVVPKYFLFCLNFWVIIIYVSRNVTFYLKLESNTHHRVT